MEVNGHEYSFTSIKSTLGTFKPKHVKSISYKVTLEPAPVEADSVLPVGATRGKGSAEASIEFATRRAAQEWIDSLGDGFLEKYFTWTLVYSETNISPVITDRIINARLKSTGIDASGTEAVGTKFELFVLGDGEQLITFNGKNPIAKG